MLSNLSSWLWWFPFDFNKKWSQMTIYKTVKSLNPKLFQWRHIGILLIILNRLWNRLLFKFDMVSAPSLESRKLSILFSFQFSVSLCNCVAHFEFSEGWICMRYHYMSSNTCSNICVCGQLCMCWWPGKSTNWGQNKMAAILKAIYLNAFSAIAASAANSVCVDDPGNQQIEAKTKWPQFWSPYI